MGLLQKCKIYGKKKVFNYWLMRLLSILPINNNEVVFSNFKGRGYGDNPKYIAESLIRSNRKYQLYWIVNDIKEELPVEIKPIVKDSLKATYHLSTAKVWIDDCRKGYLYKRKGQFYIQTWHGDIGFKKAEKDAEKSLDKEYVRNAIYDSKMIDLFVTGNDWMEENIRRAYWYDGKILKVGCPRRDIFYNYCESDICGIRKRIGISEGVNTFIYAPTFRYGQNESSLHVYNLDWHGIKDALKKRFGGKWQGMVRLHPNLINHYDKLHIPVDVINLNQYPDMQEILLMADVCISDYSSALFEFAITGKVGFIYAEDVDEYTADRGMLFDFNEIPFVLAKNNNELIDNIKNFDSEKYKNDLEDFYFNKIHFYDNGTASKTIADIIRDITDVE